MLEGAFYADLYQRHAPGLFAYYTLGTFDAKAQTWVVHGSDAHAWTQIYFAGYGWINFEPSASFSPFTRPLVTNGTNILPSRP